MRAVLDDAPDIDAVLCGSDQIARGALDTLRRCGRAVPDDVAVSESTTGRRWYREHSRRSRPWT
jgi:ABC-type sugar transport system substrate-binding protein